MTKNYKPWYWVNDVSRNFFKEGYVPKGKSYKEHLYDVCKKAEKILGKENENFADRYYENISKGWYLLPTPNWTSFLTEKESGISCVTGETWINTKCGGKQAKDIKLGDYVLTHKNRYRKIVDVMPTKDKNDIWKLKVGTRMTNLYITGNHPVLTNLGWVRVDELDVDKHLIAVNGQIEFDAKEHQIDMSEFTNYKYNIIDNNIVFEYSKEYLSTTNVSNIKHLIDVNEEVAWALGLWFAEGSVGKSKKGFNGITITLNAYDEYHIAEKWGEIMNKYFGLKYIIREESTVRKNGKVNKWLSVEIYSSTLGNLFASFGLGCKNKLVPNWVLELPINIQKKFIEAVFLGDGGIKNNANTMTLANPKLILQVYQMCLKCGYDVSLQMQEKANKLSTTKYVYTIVIRNYVNSIGRRRVDSGIKFNDGLTYCPIKILEKTNKVEDVYDFTVEEDHSFSCAGVVVHNCFGSYCHDSVNGIMSTASEIGKMSQIGGGASIYLGDVRGRGSEISSGGKTSGAVSFIPLFEEITNVISQKSRRGYANVSLPITHPDLEEFLLIRTDGYPVQKVAYTVTIDDEFMQKVEDGDNKSIKLLCKVIANRFNQGFPFISFIDTQNKNTVDVYKDKALKIFSNNLCQEIALPINNEESFVCNILAMNALHYDEWKDTDAVELAIYFMDAVLTDFIQKMSNEPLMAKAVKFAERHRALGLGCSNYHFLLLSKGYAFESDEARNLNIELFKTIQKQAWAASEKMALEYGKPELLKEDKYKRRHTTLTAVAPNTSSQSIVGLGSCSIEPLMNNFYVRKLAKDKVEIKNPYLQELLDKKGENTEEVWTNILMNYGSVSGLTFLSEEEKNLFKTFKEIDQLEIIKQAADRQKFIDQSQSLNLALATESTDGDSFELIYRAWKLGIKSLYYQINFSAAMEFNQKINCESCAG